MATRRRGHVRFLRNAARGVPSGPKGRAIKAHGNAVGNHAHMGQPPGTP